MRGIVAGIGVVAASLSGCSEQSSSGELQIPARGGAQSSSVVSSVPNSEIPSPWMDNKDGIYTFSFNKSWPRNLSFFCAKNPDLTIVDISKNRENGAYSGTSSVVVLTSPKDQNHFGESIVFTFPFDDSWPASLRDFIVTNPELMVTASFPGAEDGGQSRVTTMLVVANRVLEPGTDLKDGPINPTGFMIERTK